MMIDALAFAKDKETVIDAEFKCLPQDDEGTLIEYTEEIAETGLHLFGNKKRPQGIFILNIDLVLPLIAYGKSCGYSPGTDYKLLTFDYLNELSHIKNIAMMKQPDLLYEQEIVRWLQSVHSNTPFHSSLKTDLQIF